ncbi:cyclase family protein [Xanthobacter dioxanivorans]|uniref:Cyclase family protein n=1 Tax=Xanthobacter dioxanivorans TaxID=2528964 RepID=A0A974PRM9_9HYPH|nr:cyclase family protein [Xanthobacter dioxanivorans]QRG08488.1 cyclase family protein [Xanthobacter dioxanivorans]
MPSNPRWVHRPEGSTWGDFGADDQLGRLNLLTPAKVRQGIAEVREGRTFCLSLPLDRPGGKALNPRRGPPVLSPTGPAEKPRWNQCLCHDEAGLLDVACDDKVEIALQYSTQWDALVHVGAMFDADGDGVPEPVYYNGFRAGTDVPDASQAAASGRAFGALKLGIENAAAHGVQGRGVLVDLFARFGETRRFVGYDDLMAALDADRVAVEPGDILCLYTGFADLVMRMDGAPDPAVLSHACAVLDGRDARLLRWISDSQIAAIAADNYAVEGLPARAFAGGANAAMPLHHHCLFKLGLPLGELWWFEALAAHLRVAGRNRFLLTAPPLRLPGAAGSPVTPIATV